MEEDDISQDGASTELTTGNVEPANSTPTLGEVGNTGLVVLGGNLFDECQKELRGKEAIRTFKKMEKDPSIAAALQYVDDKLAAAEWNVRIPEDYKDDPLLQKQAEFLRQVKDDMVNDWKSFIVQAGSCGRYGSAIIEKVYRYRTKEKGSKYSDNLIGVKKLAIRPIETVDRFKFNKYNRDVLGFWQTINSSQIAAEGWGYAEQREMTTKYINRNKFMLFRHNPRNDSPLGTSPLIGVWQAYKLKQSYQESESISVAQDSNAFKLLFLPPEYMTADASEDKKMALEMYQKMLQNAHQARQSGMILPFVTDENGNKMFDFELKNVSGQKSYDVNKIIQRYNQEILLGLFADVLALGQSGGGSFSLSESKMSIIELAVKTRLEEIKSQINHDLVVQLFELNGWDTSVTPYFDYESPTQFSLDDVSKFVQRVAAVGMLPRVPAVINWILKSAGIDYVVPKDATPEELDEILTSFSSRSGDGMKEGMPSGTGENSGEGGDNSVSNSEASVTGWKIVSENEDNVLVQMNGVKTWFSKEDWAELNKEDV